MLKILSGEKGGHVLRVAATHKVRPTAANARQVLFDILGQSVIGTRWLDLYAGSGAVGLEALSRGAVECVLVEKVHRCVETIRKNIESLNYGDRARVFAAPVERAIRKLAAEHQVFDMIFLDPPYEGNEAKRCLELLGQPSTSPLSPTPESLVIVQLFSRREVPLACGVLSLHRERKLGDTRLCFYHNAAATPSPVQDSMSRTPVLSDNL